MKTTLLLVLISSSFVTLGQEKPSVQIVTDIGIRETLANNIDNGISWGGFFLQAGAMMPIKEKISISILVGINSYHNNDMNYMSNLNTMPIKLKSTWHPKSMLKGLFIDGSAGYSLNIFKNNYSGLDLGFGTGYAFKGKRKSTKVFLAYNFQSLNGDFIDNSNLHLHGFQIGTGFIF